MNSLISMRSVFSRGNIPVKCCLFGDAVFHATGESPPIDRKGERIPSFQTALQIDADAWFDLSPDGRVLATEEFGRFATRLYRIPDEGKKDQDGR
jgi:hypothetical protein